MRETDKVRWLMLFLSFIAGASIVCLLVASGVVHAQEECGEWKVREQNQSWLDFVAREIPDDIDSIWVPGPCPEERNWWDPPLDTISIDTTCKIWENIRHSGGAFSLFLKETKVLPESWEGSVPDTVYIKK